MRYNYPFRDKSIYITYIIMQDLQVMEYGQTSADSDSRGVVHEQNASTVLGDFDKYILAKNRILIHKYFS